jgi:hypothetical protein
MLLIDIIMINILIGENIMIKIKDLDIMTRDSIKIIQKMIIVKINNQDMMMRNSLKIIQIMKIIKKKLIEGIKDQIMIEAEEILMNHIHQKTK